MMQFLTKTLLKKDRKSLEENRDLKREVDLLRAEIEVCKSTIQMQNSTLRDYALANEALCVEFAMIAKWVSQKIREEIAESANLDIIGGVDLDDDEYLN